jgi:hypothetical protein
MDVKILDFILYEMAITNVLLYRRELTRAGATRHLEATIFECVRYSSVSNDTSLSSR